MATNQSAIHGRFEVTVEGQIFIDRSWGPFNLECVNAYREHMDLTAKAISGQRWAMLSVANVAPLHTPDAMAEVVNTIRHQRKMGRCATAIVLVNVESTSIIKSMLSKMYLLAEEPHIFADNEASAIAWLTTQIASTGT